MVAVAGIVLAALQVFEEHFLIIALIFIALAFLASIFISRYHSSQARLNRSINNEKNSIYSLGNGIIQTVRKINSDELLKIRMIKGRFVTERNKFLNIKKGEWIQFALEQDSFFVYIFRQILSNLKKGDCYYSISSIDFWEKDQKDEELMEDFELLEPEERKSFLNANHDAIKRGVKIKRYFIIDNKELINNPEGDYSNKVKKHLKRLELDMKNSHVYQPYVDPEEYILHNGDNIFYYYLSDNYLEDINGGHVFALIENKRSSSYMTAISDLKSKIPLVKINFYNRETDVEYNKLKEIFQKYVTADRNKLKNIHALCKQLKLY